MSNSPYPPFLFEAKNATLPSGETIKEFSLNEVFIGYPKFTGSDQFPFSSNRETNKSVPPIPTCPFEAKYSVLPSG